MCLVLLPLHCGIKKAIALLVPWVKDSIIFLPHIDRLPSQEDQMLIDYPDKKRHNLEQCMGFKKIFDQKIKAGEILLQAGRALNIREHPFPNHHNGKGKGLLLKVSTLGKDEDMTYSLMGLATLI